MARGSRDTLVALAEFCDDEDNIADTSRILNLPTARVTRSSLASLGFTDRRVLQEIRRAGRIHRFEISTRCDLQPSTLTRSAAVLLGLGLVREETEVKPGRRGKPRQYLSVNPGGAYAVGVALTAEEMTTCLTDFEGHVLWERTERLGALDPETITDQALEAVQAGCAETAVEAERIVGIGVTMPGSTSIHPPYFKPLPQFVGWDRVWPAQLFSERFTLPVWVQNDAHATAVAEAQFGAGVQRQSFMTIYIAHGFGAGLFCNGQVFTGAHGNAGSLGGVIPRPMARPGGDDLLRTLASAGQPFARLQDVEWERPAVQALVEGWLNRAAGQLVELIRMCALILDPGCVILTGLLPREVLAGLVERIRRAEFAGAQDLPRPEVLVSPLIGSGIKLGAAALPYLHTFSPYPPEPATNVR